MRLTRRTSTALIPLIAAAVVLSAFAGGALAAYSKPAGGKWRIDTLFGFTSGGTMKVAKNRKKITKLTLKVGDDYVDGCGAKQVRLKGKLKVKKFKSAGGRWAVARQERGSTLLLPIKAKFKLGKSRVQGKAIILFDETGRIGETAQVELPDCTLSFIPRK